MVMHSPTLKEGYPIPLVLGPSLHLPSHLTSPSFELILRVHVNNGFALFQNHGPDFLEVHQFCGVIIYSNTPEFTYSILRFLGDQTECINSWQT